MKSLHDQFYQKLLFPGDIICYENDMKTDENQKLIIGPGLYRDFENSSIVATRTGYLCSKLPNKIWMSYYQIKYVPCIGDRVIGLIQKCAGETFSVDIGAIRLAQLDILSFEGATKRNRPQLNNGDLVYARVILAEKDCEPVITCVESNEKANGLGALSNSSNVAVANIGILFSNKLLNKNCKILENLRKYNSYSYEITIGVNGKLWVQSMSAFVSNKIAQFLMDIRDIVDEKSLIKEIKNNFDI